jgi:hypothetical protein
MHFSQKDSQIAWILSKKLWPTVQYFIAALQAKDVLFQEPFLSSNCWTVSVSLERQDEGGISFNIQ